MREAEVRAQRAADNRRVSLIIQQLEFVQLRMEALESVLADVCKSVLERDKEWLKKLMDEKHLALLNEQAVKAREIAEKAKEERMKPKLVMVNG